MNVTIPICFKVLVDNQIGETETLTFKTLQEVFSRTTDIDRLNVYRLLPNGTWEEIE